MRPLGPTRIAQNESGTSGPESALTLTCRQTVLPSESASLSSLAILGRVSMVTMSSHNLPIQCRCPPSTGNAPALLDTSCTTPFVSMTKTTSAAAVSKAAFASALNPESDCLGESNWVTSWVPIVVRIAVAGRSI